MSGTVLVRRRALGDVVLLGAITAAVEPPVTVVTDPPYVALAARLRGVTRAVAFGDDVGPGRVVDLQRDIRTLRAFPWARKVRKHSAARWLRLQGFGSGRPTVPELYARAAGVAPSPPPWFDVPDGPRDGLALIPGASCAPKAWDAERFVAVGRAWPGPVWVLGGPGEEALVERVRRGILGARGVCERGFDATLAALARCGVAVGGDTGLLHLAAACGARPVALFGPTHPDDGFFPYDGVVLQLELPCRPCARHRVDACAVGHRGCMDQAVDDVMVACSSLS